MKVNSIFEAMRDIDPQYIVSAAPRERRAYGGRKGIIVSLAAAACLFLILSAAIVPQFIPEKYELDYLYPDSGNNEITYYLKVKNEWIYYTDGNSIKREYVNMPSSLENIFITWRYLNGLGDDIKLTYYDFLYDNEEVKEEIFEGNKYYSHKVGGKCIGAELHISGPSGNEMLTESLKLTIAKFKNIDADDVKVLYE